MATDARFDRIQKILPHDNADSLEIAMVSNFPCVVRKGEFKEGDMVFYIRDDAKLLGYDELKARELRDREAVKTGDLVTQDVFTCTWQWQDPLLKYLGGGGRVKTVKLRGKISMGILVPVSAIYGCKMSDVNLEATNDLIRDEQLGQAYLEKNFGVTHWVAPSSGVGNLNVKFAGLPCNLAKSDEENWQNLERGDLHLGERALVTKKLDGTSTTVTCYPDERGYDISSRGQTFNVKDMLEKGEENVYTKYTREAVKAGLWYAKKHNCVIAIRGETCCTSVQVSSYNKDCMLNDFFVYGCVFPGEENFYLHHGAYGTKNHFTEVVKEMNDNGFNVKTVPTLGEETITEELLKKYNDIDWSWGEGIVLNVKCNDVNSPVVSTVLDYKSKSCSYLMKMK